MSAERTGTSRCKLYFAMSQECAQRGEPDSGLPDRLSQWCCHSQMGLPHQTVIHFQWFNHLRKSAGCKIKRCVDSAVAVILTRVNCIEETVLGNKTVQVRMGHLAFKGGYSCRLTYASGCCLTLTSFVVCFVWSTFGTTSVCMMQWIVIHSSLAGSGISHGCAWWLLYGFGLMVPLGSVHYSILVNNTTARWAMKPAPHIAVFDLWTSVLLVFLSITSVCRLLLHVGPYPHQFHQYSIKPTEVHHLFC